MKILFLSTWFPYPPNQGSRTRAYHLLRELARRNEVGLVTFGDNFVRPEWMDHLQDLCALVEVVPENPFALDPRRAALGWFSSLPRSVYAGGSPEMAAVVRRVARDWKPEAVLAMTYVMAPYALGVPASRRVMDVDNLMAHMLGEDVRRTEWGPQRLRRTIAARKFRHYERELYPRFDLSLVTSQLDVMRLRTYVPIRPGQVGCVPNGVDIEHYRPTPAAELPDSLVFPGALTYEANRDAMTSFVREILPGVVQQVPTARLTITGSTEGVDLSDLQVNGHVTFSGYQDDIRPILTGSAVCVVPLRKGGGTRLKILEAMALGTPVVSTPKGAEGLDVVHGRHLMIAETPEEFTAATVSLLRHRGLRDHLSGNARELVEQYYDWSKIGNELSRLIAGQEMQ